MDVDANDRRGQLFGTHCATCGSAFTDEDRPTYTGPFAAIAATGLTMNCRLCREYAEVCRTNGVKPEPRLADVTAGDHACSAETRAAIARLVANHWRSWAMRAAATDAMPVRLTAHPLSLVMAALDGETELAQLGVDPGTTAAVGILDLLCRTPA